MAHQLRVLGSPEVLHGNGGPVSLSLGKPLALLIYVACSSSPVSRDEVADLLWPGADRQKGRHSVRQALWVIRNAVGEDLFENHDPLSLKGGALELDLLRFKEALSENRVDEARAMWRGPVLDHFVLAGVRHWNHWRDELSSDLEHRFSKALLRHARLLWDLGEADAAVSTLDQAIEVAPNSEAPHLARIEILLDLFQLGSAREALASAHQVLGDDPESVARMSLLEERLNQVIQEQRARVVEGESFPLEFVGRSRELAGLQTLWRDADLGRTRVAVITGPSGIGKTRLAQELITYVSGANFRSVAIKGTRAGTKLRWGAASDLVRQLLRLPGSAGISSASDSLLRAMLPSMGKGTINFQTVNGVSPAAILDAVSDLLESVSFEAPLAVMVDDFQWMDQDSQTILLELANRSRELRALFLILGRSDLSSRHWEDVETSLIEEAGARRFGLKPLIEEEVGELLALGAAFPQPEDASAVVAKIHQASGGNPLFIREILRELQRKGVLKQEGSSWVFLSSEFPKDLGPPENIQVLLRERMARLSEAAANLAATLARENRGTSSESLHKKTRLPHSVFSQAVAELLERGVIEFSDGTSLDFVHDILRDTATTYLAGSLPGPPSKAQWLSKNQGILALAIGILIALPLGILWGRGGLPWAGEPDPPLYGGGTLAFLDGRGETSPQNLRVRRGPVEAWEHVHLDPGPPKGTHSLFRGPSGELIFFGAEESEDGPNIARLYGDGRMIPLFPGPGDQSAQSLSPDGTRLLFTWENVGRQPFSHSLYWVDLQTPNEKHLIYEGSRTVGSGTWSPDGDLVAFSIGTASDSLAIYSLAGDRLWARAFGEINRVQWCAGSILLTASPDGHPLLIEVDVDRDQITQVDSIAVGRALACSPDGRGVVYIDVVDGRAAFVLRDLESGAVQALTDLDVQDRTPIWIPDGPSEVPISVKASRDTILLNFGTRAQPRASVEFSSGTSSPEGIWWESLDPEVASFTPEQELTGNHAGVTRILARRGHSLRDTVFVVVVDDGGQGGPSPLLRERWDSLDTARWTPFGSYPPVVTTLEGENVLQLLGGEKYVDGLMLNESINLDQGITIEYEFLMEVTQDVHQQLGFCLQDLDPSEFGPLTGQSPSGGKVACVGYPSREFEKRDLSEVFLNLAPGVETRVKVPLALPSSGWTHLALQIRPDGEATLVVNRERVATSEILIETSPRFQWTVVIDGDAVGTDVYIRNLNIWPEVRY